MPANGVPAYGMHVMAGVSLARGQMGVLVGRVLGYKNRFLVVAKRLKKDCKILFVR